jgi:hypothetical protein
MKKTRATLPGSWMVPLVSLLPLWLLSLAILVEGFPDPPISGGLAIVALVLAIASTIVLVWLRWLTLDLLLYSLFPFVLLYIFDEVSTSYKTPFILLCALVLSIGIVSARYSGSDKMRWRIWLVVNIVTWILASHALQAYWDMVGNDLVFGDCLPYAQGCPLLSGRESPWWVLFFRP